MKTKDLFEGIKAGTIGLNFCGHSPFERPDYTVKDRLLEDYQEYVDGAAGKHDGNWTLEPGEDKAGKDLKMRQHYQKRLDQEIEIGERVSLCGMHGDNEECSRCGEKPRWIFDGDSLSLRGYWKRNEARSIVHYTRPAEAHCEYSELKPYIGKIKVDSNLVFANSFCFSSDCPQGVNRYDGWSLNNLAGRRRIAKHKEEHNVAYGQTSNMTVGIYVHPNKKSIILGPSCIEDYYTDQLTAKEWKLFKPLFKKFDFNSIDGHKYVGQVMCEVWRYEITDRNTIGNHYEQVVEENEGRGLVEVDVAHGNWNFEHHYDIIDEENLDEYVYARLTLDE